MEEQPKINPEAMQQIIEICYRIAKRKFAREKGLAGASVRSEDAEQSPGPAKK